MGSKRRAPDNRRTHRFLARGGSATVELALVVPILIFLLFGILEFGFLVKNRAELAAAAREAARQAAIGSLPARINAEVDANTTTINDQLVTRVYRFRGWDANSGTWSSWQTLAADGSENNAEQGDQVQITLTYAHPLLVPGLMGPVLNADDNGCVAMSVSTIMMRE